jgi:F-type H+-transporting ATPase subunit gamma
LRASKGVLETAVEIEIIDLGRKGADFFKKTDFTLSAVHKDLKDAEYIAVLDQLMPDLIKRYSDGEFNRLYLSFNHFINVISQEQQFEQILPVKPPEVQPEADQGEMLLEPDRASILNEILPQYVKNQAFTALLDGFACEHAARMTAMDAATTNAGDLLKGLSLQYNRARQAAITTELTEIISGAESI